MKKLMILGGSRYAIPVIKAAHDLGCYVITCDYLPDNIAHKFSDEYCNISIVEKEKVLEAAKERNIDGIVSFACDPGVVAAAYVAEKMGLPFQGSYESTVILQDKGLFRKFLIDNNFNCPHARRYEDSQKPFEDIDYFNWPVIVKPVDSAGSKGVTKVEEPSGLKEAISTAINSSFSSAFIIEDFLTFEGYHSSTDVFTIDGDVKFVSFSDQLFDKDANNPYTPAQIIWPSTMEAEHQTYLANEIQRLMNLLNMKTGIYNIETCVGANGKPYIMEVSPRGGGCKIAELQTLAYGIDFIEAEVRSALGYPVIINENAQCNGTWCEMVIHTQNDESGIFEELCLEPKFKENHIKVVDLSVNPGDMVHPFTGANMALGDMFLRFSDRDELNRYMTSTNNWMKIKLK